MIGNSVQLQSFSFLLKVFPHSDYHPRGYTNAVIMHNFRVPPSPTWYSHAVCTPNNGFLYIAGNHTSIAYIPPIDENVPTAGKASDDQPMNVRLNVDSNVRIFPTHNHQLVFLFGIYTY